MKKLVVGILAHVDAGKTTLSEGLLFSSGVLRKLGRVDHRNAFLDTFALERERGITIFSKQAVLTMDDLTVTLLDTPGHADFSAETERTLQVLDCAILVVSGADGVQGHTQTLWKLLERYHVPVFLFVNKMDQPGTDRQQLLEELKKKLDAGCVDFGMSDETRGEEIALCGEAAMEEYLETGSLEDSTVADLVRERKLFPCCFGAALKLTGVEELLNCLTRFAPVSNYSNEFSARIYKISRDAQGARLTHLKVTGGTLRVKELLSGNRNGEDWQEKADQIRIYSGAKFQTADAVQAGTICAVTGLTQTYPGEGLGASLKAGVPPMLEPALTYQVLLPDGCDPHTALTQLRQIEEEDPQLHIVWHEQTRTINAQLMGAVQLEILQRLLAERFDMDVTFGPGKIVYRETIAKPVIGIGHYEPLRHYAEVHLLIEPLERGAGLQVAADCDPGMLAIGWQRLVLTHLMERSHSGVLTGSPLTDLKITLIAGRAHEKHTEGGDFRQATYRAVRQGLMKAQSVLLEPWYDFRLCVPSAQVGRAMADLQRMGGEFAPPLTEGMDAVITGAAPISAMREYAEQVTAYTKGQGRLNCMPGGYRPCQSQESVIAEIDYDAERDLENPADSVFCAHGAGYTVKWDQVPSCAHVNSGICLEEKEEPKYEGPSVQRSSNNSGTFEEDQELRAIFERTYGPVKRKAVQMPVKQVNDPPIAASTPRLAGPEYVLVDGYNVIFAWEELKRIASENLDAARRALCNILSNYQGFHKCEVILVFDAYKVAHGTGETAKYHNIHVVYTKESETADAYIERITYQFAKEHRVRVVTSDAAEQLIILGHGALRVPAIAFREEIAQTSGKIQEVLYRNNSSGRVRPLQAALTKALEEKKEASVDNSLPHV